MYNLKTKIKSTHPLALSKFLISFLIFHISTLASLLSFSSLDILNKIEQELQTITQSNKKEKLTDSAEKQSTQFPYKK